MMLHDYRNRYRLSRDIQPATAEYLDHAVRAIERWHGSPVSLSDLSDDFLNRWITDRIEAGKSRKTVKTQRGGILCLWRAAYADGLVEMEPRRVKTVRVPYSNPDAWNIDQVTSLLRTAEQAHGKFPCGANRADLLQAWLLVGYYTLLRSQDLLLLRHDQISSDGMVSVVQKKTGEAIARYLHPDAMEIIARIRGDNSHVFPVSAKTIRRWWLWLKKKSGVSGSPKWLRRTGATHCEQQQSGSAMLALGHKTPGLAYRHYIDIRQLRSRPPIPPQLP